MVSAQHPGPGHGADPAPAGPAAVGLVLLGNMLWGLAPHNNALVLLEPVLSKAQRVGVFADHASFHIVEARWLRGLDIESDF